MITLRDEIGQHLIVDYPVNREENKHSTRNQSTLEFIDKEVAPWCFMLPTVLLLI